MDKIHLSLRTIMNVGIWVILLDAVFFAVGVLPTVRLGGFFMVPSSWTMDYFIAPPDAKMLMREVSLIVLVMVSLCIIGWAKSLIEKNV